MKFPIIKKDFVIGQNVVLMLLAVVVFLAFFVVTVWGQGGLVDLYQLSMQRKALLWRNREFMTQNLLSLQELEHLKTFKYLEQSARHHLGLVRPDETVYLVR